LGLSDAVSISLVRRTSFRIHTSAAVDQSSSHASGTLLMKGAAARDDYCVKVYDKSYSVEDRILTLHRELSMKKKQGI